MAAVWRYCLSLCLTETVRLHDYRWDISATYYENSALKLGGSEFHFICVSTVGMVTRQRAGRSSVRIPAGARDFSLVQNVRTGSEAHIPSCSVGTRCLCRCQSGLGVVLASHLHLVRSLTMGTITPTFRYVPLCCEQGQLYLFSIKLNRKSLYYNVVCCNIEQVIRILRYFFPLKMDIFVVFKIR